LRVVAGELPVGLQIVARNRDGPLLALPPNMWIGAFPPLATIVRRSKGCFLIRFAQFSCSLPDLHGSLSAAIRQAGSIVIPQ
jgi:hypothetical protein